MPFVSIWSLRQGLEGLSSAASVGHGSAQPSRPEPTWKWEILTQRVFCSPEGRLSAVKNKLPCNFSASSPIFFKVRLYALAHFTGLSLLLMKLKIKLPLREACPAFRNSRGLVEILITTMILFAIKE